MLLFGVHLILGILWKYFLVRILHTNEFTILSQAMNRL